MRRFGVDLFRGTLAILALYQPALGGEVDGRVQCIRSEICTVEGLKLAGTIDDAMVEKLQELLRRAEAGTDKSKYPDLTSFSSVVTLDSPGGSMEAAMKIGRLVRQQRMEVRVNPGTICASACVLIYAGATSRMARYTGGQIGIHAPFFEAAAGDPKAIRRAYTSMLGDLRSYFREMNVSEQLADEMLKIPAYSIRFLSVREQDKFGLLMTDPVEAEIDSIANAKRLGIARMEYNRRAALIDRYCTDRKNLFACGDQIMKTGKAPSTSLPDLSKFGEPID